ncbi:UDP-glycosyltransferase 91B1 [Triticum urartu]|uniref:UDP-glycosyltransferase 91B1 n=1 Tax=Triticum urartu TaxID=4572 RepID=M7ZB75_TRIUA|nr:UDP-glycosyltransferase 91B1 [Triticum urartu]
MPTVAGLPDGAESTADVPPEKGDLLKAAFDGFAAPFAGFLAGSCAGDGGDGEGTTGFGKKPDWIFVDFAHHWLPPIAEQHKVPCALFSIFPAVFIAFAGTKAANEARPRVTAEDLAAQPPWIPFPTPIAHRLYEAEQMGYDAIMPYRDIRFGRHATTPSRSRPRASGSAWYFQRCQSSPRARTDTIAWRYDRPFQAQLRQPLANVQRTAEARYALYIQKLTEANLDLMAAEPFTEKD